MCVIDESRLDSLPENGSIEIKNIVLEQEEKHFTLPDTDPSNSLKITGKN